MVLKTILSVRCVRLVAKMALITGIMAGCGGSIPDPATDSNSPATLTLQGQLTDAVTGQAIVGAKIDIGLRSATTDANGHYEIANVLANSGGGVARDYQATITLTAVISPINMTDAATTPRYPDIKFTAPTSVGTNIANHNFKVGKLSANIQGVVGDSGLLTLGGVLIELQDNTTEAAGNVIRNTTSSATTGDYIFANVEAGVDYKLVGRTSDGTMQGSVTVNKLSDNQTMSLPLGGTEVLLLSGTDTYSPRIIKVSPENNADITPGTMNVVFTFNEPIRQNAYSIPNLSVLNNIYYDINVSYGGQKAVGNYAHTIAWNTTFDALTIVIPDTGISSIFTVDLSLALDKLKDSAGNGLESSPVLTADNVLTFTTNGATIAAPPVVISPNAPGLDSGALSVTLDWQPVSGAIKGYNIYRSARNSSIVEPFVRHAGSVTESTYTDLSNFKLLLFQDVAQSYVYRVTSINSDLIESAPSNEVIVRDVIPPTAVGAAEICVPPGGDSLTVLTTPATKTTNGQVQFKFSEPLDGIAAETVSNYTGTNISAARLILPSQVVLDFTAPITCANTNTVTVGTGIKDVAGNALSSSVVLTYL